MDKVCTATLVNIDRHESNVFSVHYFGSIGIGKYSACVCVGVCVCLHSVCCLVTVFSTYTGFIHPHSMHFCINSKQIARERRKYANSRGPASQLDQLG